MTFDPGNHTHVKIWSRSLNSPNHRFEFFGSAMFPTGSFTTAIRELNREGEYLVMVVGNDDDTIVRDSPVYLYRAEREKPEPPPMKVSKI